MCVCVCVWLVWLVGLVCVCVWSKFLVWLVGLVRLVCECECVSVFVVVRTVGWIGVFVCLMLFV